MEQAKVYLSSSIVVLFMMMWLPCKVISAPTDMPDTTLWLEVVVNGKPSGQVLPVEYKAGHYWLTANQLQSVGLSLLNKGGAAAVAVDQVKEIEVNYNSGLQQLLINLPSAWLPVQYVSANDKPQLTKSLSSTGFLMNYDIYITSPEKSESSDTVSLWSEQRLFSQYGIVSNTGSYRNSYHGKTSNAQDGRYMRYDSQWYYSDEESLSRYAAGDVISDSLTWSNSIRLGGIQFARNFSIRPDLVTYPLPAFSGQAAVPSTVDLYINSYKVTSNDFNPGPFTLDTQPYVTGAGNATVVTTDALGRKVSTTIPFYVANTLLSKGLTDYSFSAGAIRKKFGEKSFDYGSLVGTGVTRHGFSDWLTLEGRSDVAADLFSGGLGSNVKLFNWGVLNAAFSYSEVSSQAWGQSVTENNYDALTGDITSRELTTHRPNKNQGQQAAFGYSYSNTKFSIGAQRLIRSAGYADLTTYKTNYRLSRRQDQVTGSLGFDKLGNVGIGYFEVKDALGGQTRLANLSWSISLWRNTNLYTSVNKEIGGQGYSGQITLSMPLDDWGTVSLSSSRDTDNHWVNRAFWSKSAPIKGGLGWNVGVTQSGRDSDKYRQADMTWRSQYFEGRAGMYGRTDDYTRWGELSGSLVAMEGGLYASNTVNDAFALVSSNGFADVPVSYENKYVGNTNQQGYLLVPYVTAWYKTKLAIDPINLPADVISSSVEQRVSIREGSGYVVKFDLKHVIAASFKLVDSRGKAIPRGSLIQLVGGSQSWVGWDGQVWLENIAKTNHVKVTRADNNQTCQLQLNISKDNGIIYLDQQICR